MASELQSNRITESRYKREVMTSWEGGGVSHAQNTPQPRKASTVVPDYGVGIRMSPRFTQRAGEIDEDMGALIEGLRESLGKTMRRHQGVRCWMSSLFRETTHHPVAPHALTDWQVDLDHPLPHTHRF